jgi:proteasome accessory factor C
MAKSPRPGATDNLMLLLALVPYVLDKGEVSVSEAARQFQRSEEDIVEAVQLIACAGIPGENLAYSHLDLFDIDWDLFEEQRLITFWNTVAIDHSPRFTAREASALIAGLQYLAAHPAYSGREDIDEVLGKIKRGSSHGYSDRIAIAQPVAEGHLQILNDAIDAKVAVSILYHNKAGETATRLVDPLVLESRDAAWYVRAWCHHRQALRTFRVDHMESVERTDKPQGNHESLIDDISPELFQPSSEDIEVVIDTTTGALPVIADYLPRGFSQPAGEGALRLEIPFAHYGSLTRFAAAHPTLVTIVAPGSAVTAVRDFAKDALAAYQPRN